MTSFAFEATSIYCYKLSINAVLWIRKQRITSVALIHDLSPKHLTTSIALEVPWASGVIAKSYLTSVTLSHALLRSAAALASYSSAVRYSSFSRFHRSPKTDVSAYAICRRLFKAHRRKGGCAVTPDKQSNTYI
jgi:hypothetical protein